VSVRDRDRMPAELQKLVWRKSASAKPKNLCIWQIICTVQLRI